jgi:hypothetical protein
MSVDLTVADNGAGIPESEQAQLFRPFHTSKPHGTGLGLVIVKKLVTQMGGTVEVASEAGVGTEVKISLGPSPPSSLPSALPPARERGAPTHPMPANSSDFPPSPGEGERGGGRGGSGG